MVVYKSRWGGGEFRSLRYLDPCVNGRQKSLWFIIRLVQTVRAVMANT